MATLERNASMNAHANTLRLPPTLHAGNDLIESRHSLAVLAAIVLAHAAVFVAIFAAPGTAPSVAPQPLLVDLIPLAANSAQRPSPLRSETKQDVAPKTPPTPRRSKTPSPPLPTPAPTQLAAAPAGPQEPAPDHAAATPTAAAPATASGTSGERSGGVTEARFDADYLRNPPPAYPPLSRRLGEEGRVVLRVFVDAEGKPSQVDVKTSSSFQRLDQAAQQAVSHWRFVPARRNNVAVSAWVLVPIVFNLNS